MNSPESRPPVFPRPELRRQPPVAPAEQLGGAAEAAPAAHNQSPAPALPLPPPPPAVDQPAERAETVVSRPVVELPERAKAPQMTRAYARLAQEVVRKTAADPAAQKDEIISLTHDFQERVDPPVKV